MTSFVEFVKFITAVSLFLLAVITLGRFFLQFLRDALDARHPEKTEEIYDCLLQEREKYCRFGDRVKPKPPARDDVSDSDFEDLFMGSKK